MVLNRASRPVSGPWHLFRIRIHPMKLHVLAFALLASLPALARAQSDLYALRVDRAETISHGTIEHAVILVENGRIIAVGQDLPIERGIPIIDAPGMVAMPGIVNPRSRAGMDSRGGSGAEPQTRASGELYARQGIWRQMLEVGVTTLGLYPPGTGIPGLSVAVRPHGDSEQAMIVRDPAYLTIYLRSDRNSKKLFTDTFEKLDKYLEKVAEERKKFDQEVKDKKRKEDEVFQPSQPDEDVRPLVALAAGQIRALVTLRKAGDWLHFLDVLGKREFEYSLHFDLRDEIDVFLVADQIGQRNLRVVVNPTIVTHPGTRRERNLAKELSDAGARIVFSPASDSVGAHRDLLRSVAEIVRYGLDRQVALRALTLEAAGVLGLEDQLGSIEPDRVANLLLFDGDPFDPASQLKAVILEGRIVQGELTL